MAPSTTPGEPREGSKPQPIGNDLFLFLFTLCTLCAVFLLWRRASSLRSVVGLQLKTWSGGEGRIRLSMDDGPSAREFLEDDYDDDNAGLPDDEPLSLRAQELQSFPLPSSTDRLPEPPALDEDPPSPPPKS
ncbi:hypothetical protein EIP91_011979 [Steccherinum ochraceum]|uniref:Uncharacterized protein n=1 Tax=Steccherinum ochraceum TaxID=92696 RepID=A0A4V2MWV4_9APHY|nr:hypothetical protein EIP91_011979 [Steccherinum ochraceum]